LSFVTKSTDILLRDYAPDERLDNYSEADIDDGDFDEMSGAARRAAEMQMARRDRLERTGGRGRRAALRSHAPEFLGSADDMDDEDFDDLGISSMKKRTRKQYDERRDMDDLEGVENVSRIACWFLYVNLSQKFRNCLWNN
jgi:DNA replication licensing factor MCM2